MCDSIVIRPAVEGDCAFIVGLVSSLLEFGSPAWEDKDALAPGFSEVLTRAVRAQDLRSTVLIAELTDGTPLGFISLKVAADVTGVERGHVADLAVTDTARRLGVGRTLMNEGEQWARDRGLAVLSLDVWSTNERAQAFYERLGYRAESVHLIKALE
ncbi:MAG: GNAT family N-acetyltransferase [Solirubrobacteraceae bacterium]